ncbi:hypothetical protein, partial [Teichococcus deserti]|uniref:hypothetical protein n=1 Tax=Teichococcus deserti TaxID=1817963 RepID=UPI001A979FF9
MPLSPAPKLSRRGALALLGAAARELGSGGQGHGVGSFRTVLRMVLIIDGSAGFGNRLAPPHDDTDMAGPGRPACQGQTPLSEEHANHSQTAKVASRPGIIDAEALPK